MSELSQPLFVTEAVYVEREAERGPEVHRSEYVDGIIIAMTGSSKVHNRIAGNLWKELLGPADAHGCRASLLDVQVRVEAGKSVARYYPDVVVSCEPSNDLYVETAPCLIAEVLSPSTKWVDRREKRFSYLQLGSVLHYLLIDPETRTIEHVERRDGVWTTRTLDETDLLVLVCPRVEISISDLFLGT